jgi:hypothetical protein
MIRSMNIPTFYLVESPPLFHTVWNNNDTTASLMEKVDHTQY